MLARQDTHRIADHTQRRGAWPDPVPSTEEIFDAPMGWLPVAIVLSLVLWALVIVVARHLIALVWP